MVRLLLALLALASDSAGQDSTLLVLHKGGSSLGYYTPEGKLIATVATGRHPHEGVLSPDGRQLYVTDNGTMRIEEVAPGGNTVSIIDVAARRRVGEIPLGEYHRPHGVALDAATGRLAVSCELPDQLLIVDPVKKSVLRKYDTKGKTAHMVTFGPGGKWAYVSNSSSATVAAVELASGTVVLIRTGERPEGSVLSKDGRELYVTNRDSGGITVIDTSKNAAVAAIKTGKGPVRISLTPDGRQLVYALSLENKVEFADPASRRVLGQVAVGGRPISMNLSQDGKLALVSAEDIDTVYVVSIAERKIVRTFKTSLGMGPDPVFQVSMNR